MISPSYIANKSKENSTNYSKLQCHDLKLSHKSWSNQLLREWALSFIFLSVTCGSQRCSEYCNGHGKNRAPCRRHRTNATDSLDSTQQNTVISRNLHLGFPKLALRDFSHGLLSASNSSVKRRIQVLTPWVKSAERKSMNKPTISAPQKLLLAKYLDRITARIVGDSSPWDCWGECQLPSNNHIVQLVTHN